jgi:serine/threonine protein kinase
MAVPLECPWLPCSPPRIGDTIPPERLEEYERHLESCPACQERIDLDEASVDALLKVARQVGDPTMVPGDPMLKVTLERLYEVPLSGAAPVRNPTEEPIDLYFLRLGNRPDILGMLGNYEVEEVIGQGGMGIVLKAFDPALHRPVAIKVMAAAIAGSASARQRFTREAKAAAAVCHEHIVTVHGVFETDGLPYLVMQYIEGESVQTRLDRCGALELMDVVRIGLQTASGLAAAHAQGLIHRDIKPANLLLENGLARVKITDFGLARMIDDVRLTQDGTVTGTPEYMAPEQARGEPVDHRADLFSLGSVLYALCTGVPPFRSLTPVAMLREVCDQTPTAIRTLNPEVPVWLETLIGRLMAKAPADRFQSAAEVAALLEGYLAHLRQPATVAAPKLPAFPLDNGRGIRTWRWSWWLIAGVLLFALCGSLLLLRGLAPEQPPPQLPQPAQGPQLRTFYQDFRKPEMPTDPVRRFGPEHDLYARSENEGFRVKLPAKRNSAEPVGVIFTSPIGGNFEITTGYELLGADRPKGGTGAGVELYIMTDTPTQEAVGLYRVSGANEGDERFDCIRMTGAKPNRRYPSQSSPATSKTGQLRVTRTGNEVTYWASEEAGGEFRELWRQELHTEDVRMVRMAAYTSRAMDPVDVRIIDLKIRASDLAIDQASDSPLLSNTPPGGAGKGWVIGGIVFVLLAGGVVAGLVGVWRSRRATPRTPPPKGFEDKLGKLNGAVPSVVSFSCSSCGKKLRARSELAGKKVKCTQCAKAVLVPSIKTT